MAVDGGAVESQRVHYGTNQEGFLARPRQAGKVPAIILLHERYGLVQHTMDLAGKLAEAGYVALAPDLFRRFSGDREALYRGEVRVELRDGEVVPDLNQGVEFLRGMKQVDSERLVIMGVCLTGRHAVLFAAAREDLAACVVFYGAAGKKEWGTNEYQTEPLTALLSRLSCPLLGVFGEADHVISLDDVVRFRNELETYRKTYRIKVYPQAPHGWLNDTMPGRYRAETARLSWEYLLGFLAGTLSRPRDPENVEWIFESRFSRRYDFSKNVRLE